MVTQGKSNYKVEYLNLLNNVIARKKAPFYSPFHSINQLSLFRCNIYHPKYYTKYFFFSINSKK